jgi:SAM-dependent methyltransferase
MEGRKVLDFGCGYGRIARIMYYFINEENFYGMDPWDKSLEICHEDGLTKNFFLSDYLPTALPVEERSFDLIFAFSVFTHLSERATRVNLNTISKYIRTDGLIAITIRPVEYWDIDAHAIRKGLVGQQKGRHYTYGFSFLPHNREPIDGDITYGDTSMTLDWLQSSFPNLEITGIDRSLSDPYQIYVFLKVRNMG